MQEINGAMKQEWSKLIEVHPVLFYKADMIELLQILTAGAPIQNINLSVQIGYEGLKQIFTSIDEVKAFSKEAPTNELSVTVLTRDDNQEINNSLSLTMYHNFVHYQISSNDEASYLGRIAQLTNFFRKRKPWYSIITRAMPVTADMLISPAFFLGILQLIKGKFLLSFATFCFTAIMIIISFFSSKGKLFPYVRIYPYEKPKKAFTYEILSLIIAALTLLVTIFGVLLPIFSNPIKK